MPTKRAPAPVWERRTVKIACTHGPESVEAEVWGAFAVHKTLGHRSDWTVTHLPTGLRMVQTRTRAAARRFCREVVDLADWEHVVAAPTAPPEIREQLVAAVRRAEVA